MSEIKYKETEWYKMLSPKDQQRVDTYVVKYPLNINISTEVAYMCFIWENTPEGFMYWSRRSKSLNKKIASQTSSQSKYEITFGIHLKCVLRVVDSEVFVEVAMNGYGNTIPLKEITVKKI